MQVSICVSAYKWTVEPYPELIVDPCFIYSTYLNFYRTYLNFSPCQTYFQS